MSFYLIVSNVNFTYQSKDPDAMLTSLKNLVNFYSHSTVTLNSTALQNLFAISKAEKDNGWYSLSDFI